MGEGGVQEERGEGESKCLQGEASGGAISHQVTNGQYQYLIREHHNIIFRYLTLTPDQFIGSPACPPSPLLTEEESDALHIAIIVQGVKNAYI